MKMSKVLYRYGVITASVACFFTHRAGAVTAGSDSGREGGELSSDVVDICNEVLKDALSVVNLLRGIENRESADQAGTRLDVLFCRIDTNLRRLAELPISDARASGIMRAEMVALTHIAQDSLRIMQRLTEVGAYGSDKLTDVFAKYKVLQHAEPTIQAEDIPHDQLLNNLADAVDDALYILRRVHDEASARDAANEIDSLLVRIEEARHALTRLAPPRTEELREALRPTRERVLQLGNDVRSINDQLKNKNYFGSSRLGPIIERLLSATVN